jgi:type VI secretion system secreted protein VgrG
MNPQSGTPVSLVPPVAPADPAEADNATTGEVASASATPQERSYARFAPLAYSPIDPVEVSWIELQMVDEQGQPVPGLRYRVTVPDGSVAEGTLDAQGYARVEGFVTGGDCQITFPDLDEEAWETT